MKNCLSLFIGLLISTVFVQAQINYSFTPTTATYTAVSGGTVPFLSGNGSDPLADEGFVNSIPIGFTFTYNSAASFTELAISTNGFISFGILTNAYAQNNLSSGAIGERPIVAPLWDDINLQSTANLKYITTGVAPNRVFTIEWANARWGFGATNACISFEIKLYESSNWIEFAYKQETGTPSSPAASIGLTAINTGNNNFLSLNNESNNPTPNLTTEVTTIAGKPATNQIYQFKPGTLPVNISMFNVTKSNGYNTLQWQTISETNNYGFELQRSIDGVNFSKIVFVNSKANLGTSNTFTNYTANDSKPFDGINYYRLKQIDNDGRFNFSNIVSTKNSLANSWATIALYPNPVKEKLTILVNTNIQENIFISIFNMYGQQIFAINKLVASGSTPINIEIKNLPQGLYTLKINGQKNETPISKTFIK